MTTTHSSSQRLSTQLNTAQHQQHTACQPTCPTGLVTTAHRTRLDPVCARDSFGASPCALFRGRAGILRGSPCCLPRAIFTCIHICIPHMYIYMYTHMHITHVYLHVHTFLSHMYIYIHKHMFFTHLDALSLSCSFQCRQRTHPAAQCL